MARVMTSRGPARSAPPGAPRPFENDTETTSKGRDSSATDCPVATEAFHSLEPSRYVAMSSPRAAAHTSEASVERHDHAARTVVCVLDLDQCGRRKEWVPARLARREEFLGGERALLANFGHLNAGVGRGRARLVPHGVALAAHDDVVTRTRQHLERHLVRHRPAWQPEA